MQYCNSLVRQRFHDFYLVHGTSAVDLLVSMKKGKFLCVYLNSSESNRQYCCFSGLDSSFTILETNPICSRSWLCFCLQVRIHVVLGKTGANPSPWTRISPFYQTQQTLEDRRESQLLKYIDFIYTFVKLNVICKEYGVLSA